MSITVHTTHFNARPDCGDRLEKEAHVYELLDRLGISYEGVDHDTANTIEDRDKGSLRATGNLPPFLRGTGIYGTVFESYTGVRKCFGADE